MKKLLFYLTILMCQQTLAQNVPSYLPTNGLVAWWPFSGNAVDSSGNGNNGTVNGATLTTDRFGNAYKAFYFNGSSNSITINDANSLDLIDNFSISVWLNANSFPTNTFGGPINMFLCKRSNNPSDIVGAFGGCGVWDVGGDNRVVTQSYPNANAVTYPNSAGHISLNQWYNYTVTYDDVLDSLKYYLNGNLIFKANLNFDILNTSYNLFIGALASTPTYFWNGKLDDIGIWNRALTPCEIQALYTGVPNSINTNLIAQDTIKACGDSVLVSVTSGLSTYAWNTGATTSSIYAQNTGWYKVTGANASGCSASDSVFVSIIKANIINNDTTVCLGTSLTLTTQAPSIGTSCTSSGLPSNLQTGLVGYWPFCGNANDMSGNGNNGTVNGATLTTDRFGNTNSAYSFNGSSNYISLANSFFNGSSTINTLTYSVWVNPSIMPVTNDYAISWKEGFWRSKSLLLQANGKFAFHGTNPSPQNYIDCISPSSSFTINQWYHLCVVFQNSTFKLYVNNVLLQTTPISYSTLDYSYLVAGNSTATNLIGACGAAAGIANFFKGKIDDFSIYNRALSPSEVSQLYQTSSYAPSYLWSTGATTPNINVTPTQTTKYWVQVSNGISSCTDTVTITVQNPNAPAINNVAYCQGSTASALTATSAAGNTLRCYTTATGGTFTTIAPTPSTTTVGTTTYYVSQITPQGCESARAALAVTINPLPQATITASKAPVICTGDSVVYTVNPQVAGQTYTWYKNGVVIAGATGTTYAAKQSGVYSVQVFNSFGCSTTSSNNTLSVYPWPTVNAGPDKEVPAGTSVDIITQTTNAQSIAWSPVTGLSCISCASPTATVNFPIVYVVTVTSAGGCSVSDTVAIRLVCEDNLLYMPNTFTPNGDGENDRFYPMGKGLGEVNVFRIVNRLGQVVYTKTNFSANDASYGWDGTFNGYELGMDVYSYYIEVSCATGQVLKRTGDISLLR